VAGTKVPTDRAIDGVDQLDFMMGKQEKSNRDGFVVYVGNEIYGVKWENWKMKSKELDTGTGVVKEWGHTEVLQSLSRSEGGTRSQLRN
jgi:hypothetical protein